MRYSKPGLASGEGGAAPALLSATDPQGDYAFLNLKAPAFDLTDRGVAGRPAPNGLDAFVYAERGVYRSGETAYLTALLRDAQGAAALDVPLTFVIERPDGVEFRRALIADQGLGGHSSDFGAPGFGADRHLARARLHRSEAAGGRRDHVSGRRLRARPDRVRSDVAERPHFAKGRRPRSVSPGVFFTARRRPISISKAKSPSPRRRSGPGFAGYQFGLDRRRGRCRRSRRLTICRRPTPPARPTFPVKLDKLPASTPSAGSADRGAHGGARRPRGRAQDHVAGDAERQHDRRQAAVLRPLARRRRQRQFRRRRGRARRRRSRAARAALRAAAHRHPLSVLQARRHLEFRAGQDHQARRRRHHRHRARQAGAHFAAGEFRPLPARSLDCRSERPADLGRRSTPASMSRPTPIRPTCSKSRSTSATTRPATP